MRNAATLEATIARNEEGQSFTLAELAAKSTANKAIRRAELMTRIAGFERYAVREGHQGLFLTITCPSRFHRYATFNHGNVVVTNTRYDPKETPRTAHDYLVRVWARTRADLARHGLRPYGFRIAEPQHDGTPHWHLLLFCPSDHVDELVDVIRTHALQDSPDEAGAAEHRCDFKLIDRARGSAAGYVAKYVSKNIDGEHVGEDFEGRPATETAKRVEAWATTWRIRQFQQIGGPPVSVWRELRRVRTLPSDAPECVHRAHRAANKQVQCDGDEHATVAWDKYCRAQGGVECGRNTTIKMAMRPPETLGRYGDAAGLRPYGVQTSGTPSTEKPSQGDACKPARTWIFESERRTWLIDPPTRRRFDWRSASAEWAQPVQPWTRVNNCTAMEDTDSHLPVRRSLGFRNLCPGL